MTEEVWKVLDLSNKQCFTGEPKESRKKMYFAKFKFYFILETFNLGLLNSDYVWSSGNGDSSPRMPWRAWQY